MSGMKDLRNLEQSSLVEKYLIRKKEQEERKIIKK
jgi:hypothetical protein